MTTKNKNRIRVLPHNIRGAAASALADSLGVLKIHTDRGFYPRAGDVIINYGVSSWPRGAAAKGVRILNTMAAVDIASHKKRTYEAFQEAGVPQAEFTEELEEVHAWLQGGDMVLRRELMRGSSGRGLQLIAPLDLGIGTPHEAGPQALPAGVYTRYVKKVHEYRVHVFEGEVIDYTIKKVREGSEANNFQIRTHSNGWIFARAGVELPDSVAEAAIAAVAAVGLDFGGVDVGHSPKSGRTTVYEVNTAPGLEGTTLEAYTSAVEEWASRN